MKNKIIKKITATMTVMTLMMADLLLLTQGVVAAYNEQSHTNHKDVSINGYFKQAEKTSNEAEASIGDKPLLYIKVGVNQNGYLKDGILEFENNNYQIEGDMGESQYVQSVDTQTNQIHLKRVNGGEEIELAIPVSFQEQNRIPTDYFGKESNIKIKGTYIDAKGKSNNIEGMVGVTLSWKTEGVPNVFQEVEKYVGIENKVLLQTALKWSVAENKKPIEQTKWEITTPEIAGKKPSKVKIINVTGNMKPITQEDWSYDNKTGKLSIQLRNGAEEGYLNWNKIEENYKIIYEYDEVQKADKTTIALKVNGTVKLYGQEEQAIQEEKNGEIEESGSIVSGTEEVAGEIGKGYLYANGEYESNYTVKDIVQISNVDYVPEIEIKHQAKFLTEFQSLDANNSTYYARTILDKKEMESVLGEKGNIEIKDAEGNVLANINHLTEANTEGKIVIEYEARTVSNLVLQIHNPEKEGQIEVLHEKRIKGQTGYTEKEIRAILALEEEQEIIALGKSMKANSQIALQESMTKAEVSINNSSLSTVVKNENVEIRTVLKSDASVYDLYKNPVLEIELPTQIENINVKSVDVLVTDEIKISNCNITTNPAGKKVIRIETQGTQTSYVAAMNQGIQILLTADMDLKRTAPSSKEEIIVRYSNENAHLIADEGLTKTTVDIESPEGMITLNSMKNYNEENQEIVSIGTQIQVGKLEILTERKIAENRLTIINNTGYTAENPYILGRVPFAGNKSITGQELGSNIDTRMVSPITGMDIAQEEYTVYYSTNPEANGDLANANNGWETNPQDLTKVKSYLIVLNSKQMEQGKEVNFHYDIEIPEGLNYNKTSYSTYAVYYDNNTTRAVGQTEIAEAPSVGISTGEGPELEVSLSSNIENGANVEEGQIIEYRVHVKNIGNVPANNIKITSPIPKAAVYVEYKQEGAYGDNGYIEYSKVTEFTDTEDVLEAGQTYTSVFAVKAKKLIKSIDGTFTGDSDIKMQATITADKLEKQLTTNELTNKVVEGNFSIQTICIYDPKIPLKEGLELSYEIAATNISSKVQNNTIIKDMLPEGAIYKSAHIYRTSDTAIGDINYDKNTRIVSCSLGDVNPDETITMKVVIETDRLPASMTERTLINKASIKSDSMGQERFSNEVSLLIATSKLSAKQTSNKDKAVSVGENIEYYVEIINSGKITAEKVTVTDILPKELECTQIRYQIGDTPESAVDFSTGETSYTVDIPGESTARITFVAKVKDNFEGEQKEITNKVEVTSEISGNIEVNTVTNTITKESEVETPDGDKVKVYSVSGYAWEDTNKDGKRDLGENTLPSVEVILLNTDTGKIAQKASNNEDQITTTGMDGSYTFTEVKKGNYMVIFLYDTNAYALTEYKKQGVNELENSDVKNTQINMDGEVKVAAVTDKFEITDSGISGINMGLVKMSLFQLSIDKVVNKIIVQDPKGTREFKFDDSKLAKVDVDPKYINSTTVIIEYKLKISNTGDVAGFAKNIMDYLPQQLQFKSDLNTNWYLGKDGQAYNTSLENAIIQPGETKEVILTLTKKMNENGNGIVSNKAELADVYNEYAISNTSNNTEEQKTADVLIELKTGKEPIYISLVITAIAIIGVGAYFVNKKVLSKIR